MGRVVTRPYAVFHKANDYAAKPLPKIFFVGVWRLRRQTPTKIGTWGVALMTLHMPWGEGGISITSVLRMIFLSAG